MAPIPVPTPPPAPQAISYASSSLSAIFQGNKQLVISLVSALVAVLFFLSAGLYLLHLRHRRGQQSESADEATGGRPRNESTKEVHRPALSDGRTSSATLWEGNPAGTTDNLKLAEQDSGPEIQTPSPTIPFTSPPIPAPKSRKESGPNTLVTPLKPSANKHNPAHKPAPAAPVLTTERTRGAPFAVDSAGAVRPPVPGTGGPREGSAARARAKAGDSTAASRSGAGADRGERHLRRFDAAIVAQKPTLVVPEVTMSFPMNAADKTRRESAMQMLGDIIAQAPPPLSPVVSDASEAASVSRPAPATRPAVDIDKGFLPPHRLAPPRPSPDAPRTVPLPKFSPPIALRQLVRPAMKTWSKITGRRTPSRPLLCRPAIVLEDTSAGEPPTPTPGCAPSPFFRFEVSPRVDYLTLPPLSWDAPREEDEEQDCASRRPVKAEPVYARSPTPFLEPRRAQLQGAPIRPVTVRASYIRPTVGLGLSLKPLMPSTAVTHLSVPAQAMAAVRPVHKAAAPYTYF
ncbi:hypothetical protein DAEQUDRAFT_811757 [Daedalea quercina L-15889]|uniref:Uncharacterized protein n=1 Tax=Daedalea quercina L-15889 TaxID=1314783 RepID=A0A165Q103_9APHY|nr:hypothetical protein DAEQUDRAFT_811757 [Daedalea quercina L-15889]